MDLFRLSVCIAVVVCAILVTKSDAERSVSWDALEAALQEAEREALLNELYGNDDARDKRGPLSFRFRGAKRNAEENADPSPNVQGPAPAASESRPKRSPLSFRFRGAKRAPSSGFFGMRGKKDEWDSYYGSQQNDAFEEEKRGPMGFRFRGA